MNNNISTNKHHLLFVINRASVFLSFSDLTNCCELIFDFHSQKPANYEICWMLYLIMFRRVIVCISHRAAISTGFFRLCFPSGQVDKQTIWELGCFSTGTLIDNDLLNEIESVAIEIVNNHSNEVLLRLNPILTQQQQLY